MIIRRKPLGSEGIRKPRTLGLSLLREGIARVQALSVQRQSTADEPIDWGEGVPDDVYTGYDSAAQADSGAVDQDAYDDAFGAALQQAEQPVARPANEARRTARRRVQRQAEPIQPPPPQVIEPPPPAASRPVRRQALSDGDNMPADLQAMWELHKRLGHIREKPVVTRQADGSPIPRRRAQIVEMPSKNAGEPALPRSASPIGEPIQREPDTFAEPAISPTIESDEPLQLPAGAEPSAGFDADATLTDFRVDSATDVRRSPLPAAPTPNLPVTPPAHSSQSSLPSGATREYAPSPQFDGGEPDDSDDEPDTAGEHFPPPTTYDPANAIRRAAIEAAIARVERPTTPDAPEMPEFGPNSNNAPDPSDALNSPDQPAAQRRSQAPQVSPPHDSAIQRTTASGPERISPVTPDTSSSEGAGRANSVRRAAIDAAIARAEQPAAPALSDASETLTPDVSTPVSVRPASIQRHAEPPPPDLPEERVAPVRRTAIDTAVTRTESRTPPDVPESFTPDTPQTPTPTLQTRPTSSANPDSVRRAAIAAAIARAEQPVTPDDGAPPIADVDAPGSPTASPSQPAPIQRQVAPPMPLQPGADVSSPPTAANRTATARHAVTDMPMSRAERTVESDTVEPFAPAEPQTPAVPPSHSAAVRRAAIDAAIARAEQPPLPDAPDEAGSFVADLPETSATSLSRPTPVQRQIAPAVLPSQSPPVQRQIEPPGQPQVTAAVSPLPPSAPDRSATVRRAAIDAAIARAEQPAAPDNVAPAAPITPDTDRPRSAPSVSVQRQAALPPLTQTHLLPPAVTPTPSVQRATERSSIPPPATVTPAVPPRRAGVGHQAAIEATTTNAEPPVATEEFETFTADAPQIPATPASPPAVQRQATPSPSASDSAQAVRRAAIEAAIARAEQPTPPESAAAETGVAPTRRASAAAHGRQSIGLPSNESPSTEVSPSRTPRPGVQRHSGHSEASVAPPVIPEGESVMRTQAVRRSAIDAAIARAEQPAAPPSFDFQEVDADYVDVGDVYQASTGDTPDLPAASSVNRQSRSRPADVIRRSAQSELPPLNWPAAPRTPDRSSQAARAADISLQRTADADPSPGQPGASAEEVDMLRMLGLPPNTPIARSAPSTAPAARSAPPEPLRRTPITGEFVEREASNVPTTPVTASQPSASLPTDQAPQGQAYTNADVEQVAQAVYQSLRNRLRIERERSHGRVE